MPTDIRNFFGAKGSQGSVSSSAPTKTKPEDTSQSRKRRNRKVVDDSDDEEDGVAVVPPPKAQPKKKQKAEEPAGEPTTTSDYFASSHKGRPSKKEKKPDTDREHVKQEQKSRSSPRKAEKRSANGGAPDDDDDIASTRGRRERRSRATRIIEDDDIMGGDDIFAAGYQKRGKGDDDDYQEEPEEESDFEDMVIEPQESKPTPSKKGTSKSNGQKRKSDALAEDEDEDEEYDEKPRKSQARKSPQKKPSSKKPKQAKATEPESKEIQKIFDDIPQVRPPTPPTESKKFNFAAAAQHMQAPAGAGTKEVPVGAENCLAGLSFVFTGILDTLGREEGQQLVKRYGGKVTGAPSSKTSYVVLGNDAGPKKLETIRKYGIKTINEDGLFELIRRMPAHGGGGKAASQYEAKRKAEQERAKEMAAEIDAEEEKKKKAAVGVSKPASKAKDGTTTAPNGKPQDHSTGDDRLWTTKYSPSSLNMVCGNKAQVERLQSWLRNWRSNAKSGFKKGGKEGTGLYRAVMLHGPPGIGKTTAAHLVAKLEGYDVRETNASDTRSKKLLEDGLRGVLDTSSLQGYFAGEGKKVESGKKRMVLIMDEVDGMSAGDRGGVGALAAVAKKTQIPMILICNERRLPKMRPFDKIVFDIQFRRPTADQIRARLSTICFREGLKIPPQVLDGLIEGTHADIRQVINMLSTIKLDSQNLSYDEGKEMSKAWEKHIILKPWDIAGKILSAQMFSQSSTATLNDKIELYFNDHEFSYLMLQENYLKTNPIGASTYSGKERQFKMLELVDNAAESISDGDLVDRTIHGSQQQWSLMPTHAAFSFVRPASFVAGNMSERVGFTSWLGNNSKQGKMARQLKEIQGHMRLRASGDRHEIRQQYMPALWDKLVRRLESEGKDSVDSVIDLLDSYFLTREDWDSLVELGLGPMADDKVKIDTQTKATFTRLYNQRSHPLPFIKASSIVAPKKMPKVKPDLEDAIDESDEGEEILGDEEVKGDEEGSDLDLKKDKYVKAPKKKGGAGTGAGGKGGAAKSKPKKKPSKKAKADSDEEDDDDVLSESEDEKPKKGQRGRKPKGKKA